jgi:hypothetical protein
MKTPSVQVGGQYSEWKERLDGTPICDQKGSDLVVLVLNKTSQNERQLFGYSHALEAREKHISYFL